MKADLMEAKLKDTSLEGANLKMAKGLTSEQLRDAVINDKTVLPESLDRN